MKSIFKRWIDQYLSDPEAVLLLILLLAGLLSIYAFSTVMAPLLASIVIAFILEAPISRLEKLHLKRWSAVTIVFTLFLSGLIVLLFVLLPILLRQLSGFFSDLPKMFTSTQAYLLRFPQNYPDFLSAEQMDSLIWQVKLAAGKFGQVLLSFSLSSIPEIITAGIYLVLVPLLVFFLLLDKQKIFTWLSQCLPRKRETVQKIWKQVNRQLGNYVRGKAIEVVIVAVVTYIFFAIMHLQYAMLLAVLVGLSVVIPFIGIIAVTIPVVIVALVQWGFSAEFVWVMIGYTLIGALDANLLVPLLFSEAVNLHPVAIIVAILFFGGLWGFWGVFFAIPLATLIQALLLTWPRQNAHP